MTALAADAQREKRGVGRVMTFPVDGGSVIYKGAIVAVNAAGFAIPAADAAGIAVVGVAAEKRDATGLADGVLKINVDCDCEFKFVASSITQAMVGLVPMTVVDDNTVDDAAGPTNDIAVGKLTEFLSTTLGWVYVPGLTI